MRQDGDLRLEIVLARPVDVIGEGRHRYRFNDRWAKLPPQIQWGLTHGVVVDRNRMTGEAVGCRLPVRTRYASRFNAPRVEFLSRTRTSPPLRPWLIMDEDRTIAKAIRAGGSSLFGHYGGHWAQMLVKRLVER